MEFDDFVQKKKKILHLFKLQIVFNGSRFKYKLKFPHTAL